MCQRYPQETKRHENSDASWLVKALYGGMRLAKCSYMTKGSLASEWTDYLCWEFVVPYYGMQ